jgi:hypothetical protein
MTADLQILSLGAGVQSTTIALMSAAGQLPRVDAAVFADTGWEPRRVYDHLGRLAAALDAAGIPVYRVRKGNLRDDAADPTTSASLPYFTITPGGKRGMSVRACTGDYKRDPVNRKVRELLGAPGPKFRSVPRGRLADLWIGFSTDEIHRVSTKRAVQYIRQTYPLLDLGMSRTDCKSWLRDQGWTSVEKSACIGCPFHGNRQWRDLRDNHPDEWAEAVAFDEAIRHGTRGTLEGGAYLHRSRVPLSVAPIDLITKAEALEEEGARDGCSPYGCVSGEAVA